MLTVSHTAAPERCPSTILACHLCEHPFFQELTPEIGYSSCATAIQDLHPVLGHVMEIGYLASTQVVNATLLGRAGDQVPVLV